MRALVLAIATVGGIGWLPLAPGTWASLAVVPLLPVLGTWPAAGRGALVAGVVVLGVWAAGRADLALGRHDDGCIVIDEVGGMLVASLCIPATWTAAVVAFVLFRLFDVLKPFPANHIDRRWSGGLGVVCDDLVAGVYAGLATRVLLGTL